MTSPGLRSPLADIGLSSRPFRHFSSVLRSYACRRTVAAAVSVLCSPSSPRSSAVVGRKAAAIRRERPRFGEVLRHRNLSAASSLRCLRNCLVMFYPSCHLAKSRPGIASFAKTGMQCSSLAPFGERYANAQPFPSMTVLPRVPGSGSTGARLLLSSA